MSAEGLNREDTPDNKFITTYTGKMFHYLTPSKDEIDILDIAHSLALTCRYNGHCSEFYSVAQHSTLVSWYLPKEHKLAGLLHDASEAYLGDIVRPLKSDLAVYRKIEDKLQMLIFNRFGIYNPDWEKIRHFDNAVLAREGIDLMSNMNGWKNLPEPVPVPISPVSPEEAEQGFLRVFGKLYTEE